MTELELNLKLAKDIAQIRLINMSQSKLAKTSLQQEIITAMHALDERRESEIASEINDIVTKDNARVDHRVNRMFNKTYIGVVMRKLQIRAAQKHIAPFTPEDYASIQNSQEEALSMAVKNLMNTVLPPAATCTVLPYTLYELFNFNKNKLVKALNNQLGILGSSNRISKLEVTPIASSDNPEDGIYESQGTEYYNVRFYERFTLPGIVTVTLSTIGS